MSIQLQEIQSIFISQNRLVEGKDYVRAEWLKGTGCYIDTLINPAWNDQLSATTEVSRRPTVMNPCILYTRGTNTRVGMILGGAWYKENAPQFLVINKVNGTDDWIQFQGFPANAELYCSFKVVNNSRPPISFKVNGASRNISRINGSNIITELPDTTYKIGDSLSGLDVLKLKNVKINSHNFTPCQLLRSIPATLDANGIARSAGECGMIDSISGKFYGNVASSGSFTVENLDESGTVEDTRLHQIYKNKLVEGEDYMIGEWLVGDGSAYMTGVKYNLWTNQVEMEIGSTNVTNKFEIYYYVSSGPNWTIHRNTLLNNQLLVIFREKQDASHIFETTSMPSQLELSFYQKGGYAYCLHGGTETKGLLLKQSFWDIDITPTIYSCKMSYIREILPNGSYRSNLIPCKLLRSIPRNLDAQCKSRQTGECGMIDLISGRFYGNVADNGAFSLAWDEWLKDCSIQIDMEQTLGIINYAPPTIIYKGRIDATKLTSELTDFGYVKISNTQIVCNQQTWSFSNWGSNKWATIEVSYGGNGGCNVNVNGTNIGSQTTQVTGIFNPHIFLYDIVQLNKIDYTFYPVQSDPTRSVNLIFSRGVDESLGKQYMTDNDGATYRIYAD